MSSERSERPRKNDEETINFLATEEICERSERKGGRASPMSGGSLCSESRGY
jgi:hypothetical protein